jgi:hypothetical protein
MEQYTDSEGKLRIVEKHYFLISFDKKLHWVGEQITWHLFSEIIVKIELLFLK